jgi:hypothetical protein
MKAVLFLGKIITHYNFLVFRYCPKYLRSEVYLPPHKAYRPMHIFLAYQMPIRCGTIIADASVVLNVPIVLVYKLN